MNSDTTSDSCVNLETNCDNFLVTSNFRLANESVENDSLVYMLEKNYEFKVQNSRFQHG